MGGGPPALKAEALIIPSERRERIGPDGQKRFDSGHGHAYRDGQKPYESAVSAILEQSLTRLNAGERQEPIR